MQTALPHILKLCKGVQGEGAKKQEINGSSTSLT